MGKYSCIFSFLLLLPYFLTSLFYYSLPSLTCFILPHFLRLPEPPGQEGQINFLFFPQLYSSSLLPSFVTSFFLSCLPQFFLPHRPQRLTFLIAHSLLNSGTPFLPSSLYLSLSTFLYLSFSGSSVLGGLFIFRSQAGKIMQPLVFPPLFHLILLSKFPFIISLRSLLSCLFSNSFFLFLHLTF